MLDFISVLLLIVLFILVIAMLQSRGKKDYLMVPFKRIFVKKSQCGILFKEGDFVKILEEGTYWFFDLVNKYQIELSNLNHPRFSSEIIEENVLIKQYPEIVSRYFEVVDLSDMQIGLVYIDNKVHEIIPPSSVQLYWKGAVSVKIEIIDISSTYDLDINKIRAILKNPTSYDHIYFTEIKDHEKGLLNVDSEFIKLLDPGIYAFIKYNRFISVNIIDTRVQSLDIVGQEIITKDKVTLRINLSANYKIIDPVKITMELKDYNDFIYKELQFSLREVIGTNSLDELLSKKNEVNQNVNEFTKNKLAEFGLDLLSVGIKDIILPGDMRDLMNQVVEAEKQAQANLIKRREETAATRSLLNTAKLMENNPILLRLKELEALEKITERVDHITVHGGLEGLLEQITKK